MNDDASREKSDHAAVIAKPPFIYFGFILAGSALDRFIPIPMSLFHKPMQWSCVTVLIACGVLVAAAGVIEFKKAGTNLNPYKPAFALVATGIFRNTRNPMYLGLTLIYMGIAVAVDNLWMILLLIPLLWIMHVGVIFREEAYLECKFGEEYRRYKSSVRRWI